MRHIGFFDLLWRLLFRERDANHTATIRYRSQYGLNELAQRLSITPEELKTFPINYKTFTIKKSGKGLRSISAPRADLKKLQRRINRLLFSSLSAHPAAIGFEKGRSLVDHARMHENKSVVIRIDIRDFFDSVTSDRVISYLRSIGWDQYTAQLLANICTRNGSLPQGAPTSPRLSNLTNISLDARLSGLSEVFGATYTRYADDLVISMATEDNAQKVGLILWSTHRILNDEGYRANHDKRLVMRRHNRQIVCGLVVNQKANLPRRTRRWLRAVEHHVDMGFQSTLTHEQISGWRAMRKSLL